MKIRTSPACLAIALTCSGSLLPKMADKTAARIPCVSQATTSANICTKWFVSTKHISVLNENEVNLHGRIYIVFMIENYQPALVNHCRPYRFHLRLLRHPLKMLKGF